MLRLAEGPLKRSAVWQQCSDVYYDPMLVARMCGYSSAEYVETFGNR